MKHIYNVHTILSKSFDIGTYTSKGLVIGRPFSMGSSSVDELEKDGWVGVYDPNLIETKPLTVSGSIVFDLSPNPFGNMDLGKIVKSMVVEPESTLDDRIKETQRDLKNPAKYRARWTGTKYVYESID